MSIEFGQNTLRMEPAPFDPHMHPRVFDVITRDDFVPENEGKEGKAGLEIYTRAAFLSGIAGGLAMPNEMSREHDILAVEKTIVVPTPITDMKMVRAMGNRIATESLLPMGIILGVDPDEIFLDAQRKFLDEALLTKNFEDAADHVFALKIYGDETTGGFNVGTEHIPDILRLWHGTNPGKPAVLHLEDDNVACVLQETRKLPEGSDIAVHIAHVSSRQELEAVIVAKTAGMNVTCEATPHHLFLDDSAKQRVGGYGCMKPTLKTRADVNFLWANMRYIDAIASDCAPHRRSDKEAENPAYGVTNHTVMLPLLLGAAEEGKILHEELHRKMCINPRIRFNLPVNDNSRVDIELDATDVHELERRIAPGYGHNVFQKVDPYSRFRMIGRVVNVQAGVSVMRKDVRPSYTHWLRPKNLINTSDVR